jgi:acyl dehydratase
MTDVSGIVDELKKYIGMLTEPVVNEVERGAIRRYAEAIDDPNPLYSDLEDARNSKYRELICPPGFFGWPKNVSTGAIEMMGKLYGILIEAGLVRMLDGGVEYEFFVPVRAGDTLTWYAKFADVQEREGKSGKKMVLLTTEMIYINQNGDLVAKRRQTFIAR